MRAFFKYFFRIGRSQIWCFGLRWPGISSAYILKGVAFQCTDLTEKLKDDIQNLKDKVNRHEQYFWLAGALAVIFGLTGAHGLNAFQTLRQRINEESERINVVQQDVDLELRGPIDNYTKDKILEINRAAENQVRQLMKGLTDANDTTKPKPKECGLLQRGTNQLHGIM